MTPTPPQSARDRLCRQLTDASQSRLLAYADTLNDGGRQELFHAIVALDPDRLSALRTAALSPDSSDIQTEALAPAPCYPLDPASPDKPWDRDQYAAIGEALIRAGKVAAFTVAGGQGTRLGYDGPKGCHHAGAVTGKPLFAMLAEQVLAASKKYSVAIPWRLMTSPLNHDATVAFFTEHNHFGLDPQQVGFFRQGVLPTFDADTGDLLLAGKHQPATNPDGHGGSLKALYASGALNDLRSLGVEHLSYTQIDNPLVRMFDPVFLGLHTNADDSSAQMSSKMIAKKSPAEKVGVFCLENGVLKVIEYSDLPADLAQQRTKSGALRFNAGSPAIHIISLDFVRQLNESSAGFALPLHRARKKVSHIDLTTGERIEPTEPNAIKLESFVFDALPICDRSIVVETDRMEFAPIKNATGADSYETCGRLQTERAASWLEAAGVHVPRTGAGDPDCTLEISPLTALSQADLAARDLPREIKPGERLAL